MALISVFLVLVIVAALMTAAALFIPKGPHQVLLRSSIMLTLAVCYLMWMVTYLAQLHPLISPIKPVSELE